MHDLQNKTTHARLSHRWPCGPWRLRQFIPEGSRNRQNHQNSILFHWHCARHSFGGWASGARICGIQSIVSSCLRGKTKKGVIKLNPRSCRRGFLLEDFRSGSLKYPCSIWAVTYFLVMREKSLGLRCFSMSRKAPCSLMLGEVCIRDILSSLS